MYLEYTVSEYELATAITLNLINFNYTFLIMYNIAIQNNIKISFIKQQFCNLKSLE